MKADLKGKYRAEVVTSIHLDSYQFDRLVEDTYGTDPEFVAAQEANNNSSYEFDYSKYPEESYDYIVDDKERIQSEIRSGVYPRYGAVGKIITTLIDDGVIPPANYIIKVSW